MIADIVFLNGQFLPLADAKISPLDRGFLFADGVYEVIPVYSRQPFRLDEHLRRLQASLDGIRLANPLSTAQWLMNHNFRIGQSKTLALGSCRQKESSHAGSHPHANR